jgi:hypothetical protein
MTEDKGKKGYGVLEVTGGVAVGGVVGLATLGKMVNDVKESLPYEVLFTSFGAAVSNIGTKNQVIAGIVTGLTVAGVAFTINAVRNMGKDNKEPVKELNPAHTNKNIQEIIANRANGGQNASQEVADQSFART